MARKVKEQRGAAAVEFALVAIPLLVLIAGIIQFSIWFWAYQVDSHAAREAARFGATAPCDDAAIIQRATDRIAQAPKSGTPDIQVTVTKSKANADLRPGDEIEVRVQFNAYDIGLFPFFPDRIDKSATARVENIPAGGC